jgi:hypothetical protein
MLFIPYQLKGEINFDKNWANKNDEWCHFT